MFEYLSAGGDLPPAPARALAGPRGGEAIGAPSPGQGRGGEGSGPARAGRTPRGDAGLAPEGRAILLALLEDLAEAPGLRTSAIVAPTFPGRLPRGVRKIAARPGPLAALRRELRRRPGPLLLPVAPETGGTLEQVLGEARAAGADAVAPPPGAVARAADRSALLERLSRAGIPTPPGGPAASIPEAGALAQRLGYPVVVKPGRGAGGQGVRRVEARAGLGPALRAARAVEPGLPPLVQAYLPGVAASVSLLLARGELVPLALNRQRVRFAPDARYEGGATPLDHPDREASFAIAAGACRAVGGLRGPVGVDLVLGRRGPVVVEVNPRLTTAYLGLRAHGGPALLRSLVEAGREGGRATVPEAFPLRGPRVRFRATGATIGGPLSPRGGGRPAERAGPGGSP